MKNLKKYMGLLLALVMCLSLVACGGAPDKLKVIVIDDSVVYDYSAFSGTWSGENDSRLVMKEEEDGRKHFILSDADDEWIASGLFQYAEEMAVFTPITTMTALPTGAGLTKIIRCTSAPLVLSAR